MMLMPTKNHQNNNNAVVSSEKCVLCLNKFGTVANNVDVVRYEFPNDGTSETSFMTKYNLPEKSAVCISCVNMDATFEPLDYVFSNAHSMGNEKMLEYISVNDIASQLMKSEKGRKLLVETKDAYGWSALHNAVHDKEFALGLIRTDEGRQILIKTRSNNGWSAFNVAIDWHDEVALELIKTEEGRKLLSETKYIRELSILRVVISWDREIAVELAKTEEGRRTLVENLDAIRRRTPTQKAWFYEVVRILSQYENLRQRLLEKLKSFLGVLPPSIDANGVLRK